MVMKKNQRKNTIITTFSVFWRMPYLNELETYICQFFSFSKNDEKR